MNAGPSRFVNLTLVAILTAGLLSFALWEQLPWGRPGFSTKIAQLKTGTGWRRTPDSQDFLNASRGAEFYSQDALWVPAGQTVVVEFHDGRIAEIQERTLIVFRKPFIEPDDSTENSSAFRVLQGKVKPRNFELPERALTGKNPPAAAQSPSPSPSDSTSPEPSPEPRSPDPGLAHEDTVTPSSKTVEHQVHPKPGSQIFLVKGDITKVTFSWPEAQNGHLEVTPVGSGSTQSIPVLNARFARAELKAPADGIEAQFEWKLKSPTGEVLEGPHSFRLQKLSKERMSEILLKSGEPDSMIYVQ